MRKLRLLILALLAAVPLLLFTAGPAAASVHGEQTYNPAMAWSQGGFTYTVKLTYGLEQLPGGCRPYVKAYGFRNGIAYSMNFEYKKPQLRRSADNLLLFDPGNTLSGTGSAITLATPTWYTSSIGRTYKALPSPSLGDVAAQVGGGAWHSHHGTSFETGTLFCD